MLKKLFLLSITLFASICALDHSGLKFGIDTNIFKFMKTMNLNKIAQNRSLVPEGGLNIEVPIVYKIHIGNLTVENVKNPEDVEVFTRRDGDNQYLNIILKNFEVDLKTNFDIEVIKVFKDHLVDSPINIHLERIDSEFYFNGGFVKFNKLDVTIGKIDMKFNSIFFKAIYAIADKLIINMINKSVSNVYHKLEEALNQFITSQMLIDVGMGIGINATNVDRPELTSYEKSLRMELAQLSIASETKKFLPAINFNAPLADNQATILKFGIHGSLYPNAAPEIHPDIKPAVDMQYITKTFNNELTLLISDYSLNSLLFMIQQTGAIKKVFTNDTANVLPFTIDTQGVSSVIPEISAKYPENKNVEIKMYINAVNHKQPLIFTEDDGSELTVNFGLDLNVFNSTDPWDDPNKELQLDVTVKTKLQYLVSDNKLNVICFRAVVDSINKKLDNLNVSEETLRKSLDGIVNEMLKTYKPYLTNIDVFGLVAKSFDLKMNSLYVNTENEYTVFSIDIDNN